MHQSTDRNLLFGIIALQQHFVSRDQLIGGMRLWVLDKDNSLGNILVSSNVIDVQQYEVIQIQIDKELRDHPDIRQRLQQLCSTEPFVSLHWKEILDTDQQTTLRNIAAESITPQSNHPCNDTILKFESPVTDNKHEEADLTDPFKTQPGLLPIGPSLPNARVKPIHRIAADRTAVYVGGIFGDFEVLEELGHGGMGKVFKARQLSLNRLVALKVILNQHTSDLAAIERFKIEAQAAACLDHPGIVQVYQFGDLDGVHYIAMALVSGSSLDKVLRDRVLSSREAASIIQKSSEAIAFAHQHGVIHRDVKPANILIDHMGDPKITDFGLAKLSTRDQELTLEGQIMGSVQYMAPEQALGNTSSVGPSADVYSLGATFYRCIVGRPPFQASSAVEVLRQVREVVPVQARQLNGEIELDVNTICMKCLEKDPTHRFPSAAELASELQRFLNHEPIQSRPTALTGRVWRWAIRHPAEATLGLAMGTVVLLVGVLVAVLTRTSSGPALSSGKLPVSEALYLGSVAGPLFSFSRLFGVKRTQRIELYLFSLFRVLPRMLAALTRVFVKLLFVSFILLLLLLFRTSSRAQEFGSALDTEFIILFSAFIPYVLMAYFVQRRLGLSRLTKHMSIAFLLGFALMVPAVALAVTFENEAIAEMALVPFFYAGIVISATYSEWLTGWTYSAVEDLVALLHKVRQSHALWWPLTLVESIRYRRRAFELAPMLMLGILTTLLTMLVVLLILVPIRTAEHIRSLLTPDAPVASDLIASAISIIALAILISRYFIG